MTGAGYLVVINDIAGPFSGILFGLSNTISTVPGIVSPYLASLITKNVKNLILIIICQLTIKLDFVKILKQTQKEWQIVFIICTLVYFVGGSLSVYLLDARMQPWAKIDDGINNNEILLDKKKPRNSNS